MVASQKAGPLHAQKEFGGLPSEENPKYPRGVELAQSPRNKCRDSSFLGRTIQRICTQRYIAKGWQRRIPPTMTGIVINQAISRQKKLAWPGNGQLSMRGRKSTMKPWPKSGVVLLVAMLTPNLLLSRAVRLVKLS